MSLFKKFVKGKEQSTSSQSNSSIHTNEEKTKTARLEDQIKHLNNYIQELVKENEVLQDRNNDMRTTLKQNKQLLDDYINTVGQNDALVQKMKKELDSLRAQLNQQTIQNQYLNGPISHNDMDGAQKQNYFHANNNQQQTMGYASTKATTTVVFYQTSPKNALNTSYNLTTMMDNPNGLQSNYNLAQQNQQKQNLNNGNNHNHGQNQHGKQSTNQPQIQVQCPKCQICFRQPLPPQILQQNMQQQQQQQEQLLMKQKELQDELETLRNEVINLMREKQAMLALDTQSDHDGMISQRSNNQQMGFESYRPSSAMNYNSQPMQNYMKTNSKIINGRESTLSTANNRRLHTLSQMFVDKNYGDLSKIQEMLDFSQTNDELILFTDSKGNIWQIIQRDDLTSTDIQGQILMSSQQMAQDSVREQTAQFIQADDPGFDGLDMNDLDGKQVMISHQSDYDEEDDDNGTGGQYEDDEEYQDSNQVSDRNGSDDLNQRKRQAALQTLQNHLSNQKTNQGSLLGSQHSHSSQINNKGKSNINQQMQQQDIDDKNVIVSVLNTEEF